LHLKKSFFNRLTEFLVANTLSVVRLLEQLF
jgi:hypothetical protein